MTPLHWLLKGVIRSSWSKKVRYLNSIVSNRKLDSPDFKALLTPDLLHLGNIFECKGYSLRLVGGVVRDLVIGHKPQDVDLATECHPNTVVKLLENEGIKNTCLDKGFQHGTVIAHMSTSDYEITTLRVDRVTDGRHAVVEFTDDWKVDAERRDLTINAMSLSLDGTLYDYNNGQQHLTERKILFVGDPHKRINEDYLRILRYFRFYGRISLSPDNHDQYTLTAITDTAHGLKTISVERIWMEMKKILLGNYAPDLISLMYKLGVASNIGLPCSPNIDEFSAVWSRMHSQTSYTLDPVSLLVSLVTTATEAEQLSIQWKQSKYEQLLGVFVASHREHAMKDTTTVKYFQDMTIDKTPKHHVTEVLRYCGRPHDADIIDQWDVPTLPVNGHDILLMGVTYGRDVGKALKIAKKIWKKSNYTIHKDQLMEELGKKFQKS